MNLNLKEISAWFTILIFSLIWLLKPISFQEMQHRHRSSFSSNEVNILYSKSSNVILAVNSSNNSQKFNHENYSESNSRNNELYIQVSRPISTKAGLRD